MGTEEAAVPGPMSFARTPYMREPMQAMTLSHPASRVTVMGAAQIAKTQGPICLLGQIVAETPATVMVLLPSNDEAVEYAKGKLGPMIANTPAVAARVVGANQDEGSTLLRKVFPGGVIEIVGANSSKGLQSRSRRVLIMEEISEYPWDVDRRGDPVQLAERRTNAFQALGMSKIIAVSTPGMAGACRITSLYETGSRGVFKVPCPHCAFRQELRFDHLVYRGSAPTAAAYHCEECGAEITEAQKPEMIGAGEWIHERPELANVHPSYRVNALYSPFVDWAYCARQMEDAKADPSKRKSHWQQDRGEAYRLDADMVQHVALWERRRPWRPDRYPAGIVFLEGATDVQGDRLEWAVYGFDEQFGQWWLDGGIISGDPEQADVWHQHDELLNRRWRDAWGRDWAAESWGIDTGYKSHHVYRYVRRHAAARRPRVMALKGFPSWNLPPIGQARPVDIDWMGRKFGTVQLWPVGTWDLKSELAGALARTIEGPNEHGVYPAGAMHFPDRLDIGFFEQITAESLDVIGTRNGMEVRAWVKRRARNEQFDLAVYARALARHDTSHLPAERWRAIVRERTGGAPPDLVDLMTSGLLEVASPIQAGGDVEIAPSEVKPVVTTRADLVPKHIPPRRGWLQPSRGRWI